MSKLKLIVAWTSALLLAVLASGCREKKSFSIEGDIEGFGTGNLRIVYYAGGAARAFSTPVVDGKFNVTAPVDAPTLARIYNSAGAPFGWLVLHPGDEIKFKTQSSDPFLAQIEGSESSARLYAFIKANLQSIKGHDTAQLNAAAASYISLNPDKEESAVILSDFFNSAAEPAKATELLALLPDDIREITGIDSMQTIMADAGAAEEHLRVADFRLFSRGDSLQNIRFADRHSTLICYLDEKSRMSDSIISLLEKLQSAKDLQIVGIGCEPDTLQWHRSLKQFADSTEKRRLHGVTHLWAPSPFNIDSLSEVAPRRIPWFVVADSTSKVIYRGPSATKASQYAR